jgi:integrase
MKIALILDKRKKNKEGKYPIKFRFTEGSRSAYSFTGIYAFDDEFTPETFFKEKDKHSRRLNELLSLELDRAEQLLHDLNKKRMLSVDPSKFKDLFIDKKISFNSYFQSFIESKAGRTKEIYQSTLNKLETFIGTIDFEDVNFSFLKSFDQHLQKKSLKTNARGIHFRNIRAVFNHAINEDIVSLSLYPFRKFKIKKESTLKRAISVDELHKLFNYDGNELENRSRDVAKLIFYLIGINVKDLVFLKGIESGRIQYNRFKTSTPISIKIEPEALQIVEKYRGTDYLLKFVNFNSDYRSFNAKINKHLKKIGIKVGISNLTTYVMRHTWATIAAELDIPKETISMALGHSFGSSVTDIYIHFNRKKVDDANRKIIDYIQNRNTIKEKISEIIAALLSRMA